MLRESFLLSVVLIGFLGLHVAEGALSRGTYHNEDHPGKCALTEYNLVLSPGETAQWPGTCGRIECVDAAGNAQFATCGVFGAPDGCHADGFLHPDADYPECCQPKFVCK